ncbi:RHS repeat-associated core domain-containing protein [Ralstonia syzygii]|uniref:RHS repeat-associated core domain-containing protein n=1 Tax=Ralstonia syzygii TaxID=28097 RepID=UPI00399D6840
MVTFLFIAPFSQELEPPQNPGRFTPFTPRYDAETGKHYNANRDYDPASGRYVQSDPIGLNGGQPSTYAYVDGQPTRYVDPTGQITIADDIVLGTVMAGTACLMTPGCRDAIGRVISNTASALGDIGASLAAWGAIKLPKAKSRASRRTIRTSAMPQCRELRRWLRHMRGRAFLRLAKGPTLFRGTISTCLEVCLAATRLTVISCVGTIRRTTATELRLVHLLWSTLLVILTSLVQNTMRAHIFTQQMR